MYRVILVLYLLSMNFFSTMLYSQSASSQQWKLFRYELDASVATSNYFGDIGGAVEADNLYGLKDIDLLNSRPSVNIGARYYLTKRIALRPSFLLGIVYGSDKKSFYNDRGYEFNTFFFMPKINVEISLIMINDLFGKSKLKMLEYSKSMNKTFVAYVTGGAGYNLYNVRINDAMNEYIPSVQTEVNEKRVISKGWDREVSIHGGFGVKYFFARSLAVSFSIEYHSVMADNLDGFATETNTNDMFYVTSFGLSYRLPTDQWGKIRIKKRRTN